MQSKYLWPRRRECRRRRSPPGRARAPTSPLPSRRELDRAELEAKIERMHKAIEVRVTGKSICQYGWMHERLVHWMVVRPASLHIWEQNGFG